MFNDVAGTLRNDTEKTSFEGNFVQNQVKGEGMFAYNNRETLTGKWRVTDESQCISGPTTGKSFQLRSVNPVETAWVQYDANGTCTRTNPPQSS
jgi:hypothetical protein